MRLVGTEVAATRTTLEQLAGPDARAFLRDALAFSHPWTATGWLPSSPRWAEFLAAHQLVLGPVATARLPPG
jgi:hypothetical protein